MPEWTEEIRKRLASLKLPPTREAEIVEELTQHVEDRYRELLSGGATEEEARRLAVEELSGEDLLARGLRRVEQEATQEPIVPGGGGRNNLLASIWQDIRYGLRMLARNPGFAAVVVLTLGLGIGLNSGIFSLVSGLLIREPPVKDPGSLMALMTSKPAKDWPWGPASAVEFAAWRDQNHVFRDIGAGSFHEATLSGRDEPLRVPVGRVTANYFELFGVPPSVGRTFNPGEKLAAQEFNAVISFDLWQRRLNADPNIIGRPITLDGQKYTVIGVMPRQFQFTFSPCDAWVPVSFSAQALRPEDRHNHSLNIFVRLRNGVRAAKAQAEVSTILQQIAQDDPEEKGWTVKLMTLRDFMVDEGTRMTMGLLMGTVAFVLLIACANVAGIYLARSATRQQEFAVRAALGAPRARLVRQLLGESSVLALLGGGVGLLLASLFVQVVRAKFSFDDNAPWVSERMEIEPSVVLFTLAISVLTVFLFALHPALQTSKPDIQAALKEGGRTASSGPRQSRTRSRIVVEQIIFTMVLMAGAGTMIQAILGQMMAPSGFNPQHVLTVDLSLAPQKYDGPAKQIAFSSEVVERSKSLPGVESAAVTHGLPRGPRRDVVQFELEGQPAMAPEERPYAFLHAVSPDYFRVMGIPLLRGRSFPGSDTAAGPRVAVVNEAFVKRFYPKSEPIGTHIRIYKAGQETPTLCDIVGIVGNVKEFLGDPGRLLQMYVPFVQAPATEMTLVLRTNPNPASLASAVRGVVWAIDKDQPIELKTMQQLIDQEGAPDRFIVEILAGFTALALLLSGIGIYGVVSYVVAQRTHEIGLRMALGAGRREVLRLVVGKGAMLSGIGVLVGFLLSYPVPRLLVGAYGDSEWSIRGSLVIVIAPVLVSAVALLASYVPARRATKVDPMVALRYE